mgnify:FL=1
MARKKYNYNFVRKPSEGGKEALYMAGASVFLFLLASVVSFAFRGTEAFFSEQRDCSHFFCRDTASMWE